MPIISSIRTSVENQQALILDPHAKRGSFCRDTRGRLLSFSGGYTVVYPYKVNSEKWAFRCWHTEMGNVRRRFEIIARAIKNTNAKYLCDFAYVDEGIIVDGKVYPTTRMRWIEGSKIKDYICSNKANKVLLEQLAKNFLTMVQDMHSHHLAHGDLQHGNIIVDISGNLFLVDYDSFYCDELSGEPDIITGLKDYQHPLRRTNQIITEKVDYFSELIIYLSILGIAAKPELVEKYQVEDSEHMLFEADDFIHLHSSKIYQELHGLSYDIDMLLIILDKYLAASSLSDLRPFDIELDELTKDPVIHSFTSSCGDKGLLGKDIALSWCIENYNKVLLNGKDVTGQSSQSFKLTSSSSYVLEVLNGSKVARKSIRVDAFGTPHVSLSSNKDKLHKGKRESVTLSWGVQNSFKITLLQDGQVIKDNCRADDSYRFHTNEDTSFVLRVIALDKKTVVKQSTTVRVYPDATLSLESDKEYVFPSIPFTLTWKTKNANSVELNGKKVEDTGTLFIKDGVEKETSYVLSVTDEFGAKEQKILIKMLPLPRIESLIVPSPNIEKNVEVQVNLDIPDISVELPNIIQEEVLIVPPEIYELGVDTSAAQSPPKVKLIELRTPNLWTKLELILLKLKNKIHNEVK